MYGMVNNAIQELVTERAGEAAWGRVCDRAGANTTFFVSLDPYPDELTFGLAVAAASELGLELGAFLEEFGRYWIQFALRSAYGPMLRSAGSSLATTLASLDHLHSRIGMTFPSLRPPSFRVTDAGKALSVQYFSEREGLAPFVVGLLYGLAAMHGETVEVEHTQRKSETVGFDEFTVTRLEK